MALLRRALFDAKELDSAILSNGDLTQGGLLGQAPSNGHAAAIDSAELSKPTVRAIPKLTSIPVQQCNSTPPTQHAGIAANGQLVQASAAMRELVQSIALAARATAPVMILGESGTGKERVARAIHAGGPRAARPFVAINTSAIPEQLLESELFGHVRGAFTGAIQSRAGLLFEADGGTLFLDEIGEMPLVLQAKLLRVLQFGETRPVGSDRLRHVDVRVITATHRDLDKLVNEGLFRDDLRYRLKVIPLYVPPLRDRSEDIPPLVEAFLEQAKERNPASPVQSISDQAMSQLMHAAWPGNVRELEMPSNGSWCLDSNRKSLRKISHSSTQSDHR